MGPVEFQCDGKIVRLSNLTKYGGGQYSVEINGHMVKVHWNNLIHYQSFRTKMVGFVADVAGVLLPPYTEYADLWEDQVIPLLLIDVIDAEQAKKEQEHRKIVERYLRESNERYLGIFKPVRRSMQCHFERLVAYWGKACVYCQATAVDLQVEHIIPHSRGGPDAITNLTLACAPCNQSKGSLTAAEFGFPEIHRKAARIPRK